MGLFVRRPLANPALTSTHFLPLRGRLIKCLAPRKTEANTAFACPLTAHFWHAATCAPASTRLAA